MRNRPDTVTASDIAEYAYCPEAWRLKELGHESANQTARERGTRHHALKAFAERVAAALIALGRLLIVAALLALAAWWFVG